MLVLSRKSGESLLLRSKYGDVEIKVLDISPNKVRLGITAPKEVTVIRNELLGRNGDEQLRRNDEK